MELILRKYEAPTGDFKTDLRIFLLSLGLIRPGEKSSPVEKIFSELLKGEKTIKELSKVSGISENAVRYQIRKLKSVGLVEGRKTYRIAEGNLVFAVKMLRFRIEEILKRIEEYAESLLQNSQ